MHKLQLFYQDKATREELMIFFERAIREKSASDLFAGRDVSHYLAAKRLIDSVWDLLAQEFGTEQKAKEINIR